MMAADSRRRAPVGTSWSVNHRASTSKMMKLLLPLVAGAACAFHVGAPAMRGAVVSPMVSMQMSDTMAMLSAELKKAQAAAKGARTTIDMLNAQEWVDELCDRMDKQAILEPRVQLSETMTMLSAQLAKAQSAAKLATTEMEMCHAQEWVDELCDRMDKQEVLELKASEEVDVSKYAKYALDNAELEEKNAALAEKMKSVIGDGLAVNTEMYELIELHEL